MTVQPLSGNSKPLVLFRAECERNSSFIEGYVCARRTNYEGPPSLQEFDDHLSWRRVPTRFLSFGTWKRALQRRKQLENELEENIVVIAVWAEHMTRVFSAKEAATRLAYRDPELYGEEYLVEGGIVADDYRVLAVFEGGGPARNVVFAWPFYEASTTIPSEFFPGLRSHNALEDIADEIYSRLGVRDDRKRDELVKAILGSPWFFPAIRYQ
ncbi:uncharacterized protein BO72DRAFT_400561 [Aspergillus fijiensis CBS 313.89]|uniref:Uncharacterized protein n=1 Tax=Aspergillus fijiensis CBS 313.89 TaxID=1448319 RepID=A0A8G1RWQ6_9EURO|nr:uncharacterized protein BO72DRAFT_400561 [Aspergillus fijiensis CBS 313.89]RAK79180.1 hypothetical protein BO72DRAFT_400561 [Aspergillus fijiensis CBS 313.89]